MNSLPKDVKKIKVLKIKKWSNRIRASKMMLKFGVAIFVFLVTEMWLL